MSWKDFLSFSRTERRGILILLALIVLVLIAYWFIPPRERTANTDEAFKEEYAAFKASLHERNQNRKADDARRRPSREVVLVPFDPNTTDSAGFARLGLPPWMAKNILRYRAKGGKFRQPDEFKKVYGLTEAQYATLLPYITIGEAFARRDTVRLYTPGEKRDSLATFKYPVGTILSLNQADTTELKKIPGIGSGIARMIVGYRKQLGGFYRVEQLSELKLNIDLLRPWLSTGSNETRRMNLNKASVERLNAHPYLNFYQAKVIVGYRKKKGALNSLQQLKLYDEFTPQDLERLAPYVCFE